MEAINRFSLMDFLAYFFPGVVGLLGIFLLLLLTPLKNFFTLLTMDLTLAVLLLALSYVIGIILSGFSTTIVNFIRKIRHEDSPRSSMPIPEFGEQVIYALKDIFKLDKENKLEWSRMHFYVCRSLVLEYMPNTAQIVQRENSLRVIRMNLITPALIWFGVGISWGVWCILNNLHIWGIVLFILSVVLIFPTIQMTISRMYNNEKREAREIIVAFLVGYNMGMFDKRKKQDS